MLYSLNSRRNVCETNASRNWCRKRSYRSETYAGKIKLHFIVLKKRFDKYKHIFQLLVQVLSIDFFLFHLWSIFACAWNLLLLFIFRNRKNFIWIRDDFSLGWMQWLDLCIESDLSWINWWWKYRRYTTTETWSYETIS